MKKWGQSIFILFCLLVAQNTLFSQEKMTLTLDDCLMLALSQNPYYQVAKEKEVEATALVREAASRFFPTLNAMGINTLDEKLFVLEFPSLFPGEQAQKISIDFTKNYQLSLNFSLPLFTGGRLISGFKQSNYNLQSTKEGIRQSRHQLVFNVKKAFYGYLLAKDFFAVAEETMKLAEKQLINIKNLYEAGMAAKFELLRFEVQVANIKTLLIQAKNGLEVTELGLKTILGLELQRQIEVKGELTYTPMEADVNEFIAEALQLRPELNQLKYQGQMASEMLKIARASKMPTLALGGAFNYWGDKLSFAKGNWQNYYAINLVLTVPIFNGFAASAQVGQAKAVIKELEFTQKGMSDLVKLEVQQAVLNHKQAEESLRSQEKNVEVAKESVRLAELNFQEGLATSLDVSTSLLALSQAKTNYSQVLYDCAISVAQLEKARGGLEK